MNVTASQRTEIDYSFKMSQSDLERYLADPWQWREDILVQLGPNAPKAAAPAPTDKPARRTSPRNSIKRARHGNSAVARLSRPAPKNGHSPRKNKANGQALNSLEPLQCPHCPKRIARKYLPNHLRKVHGVTSGETGSSASSPAAVPAAV